jgi:DNA repair exonuclease SbcCD nuclease subunit
MKRMDTGQPMKPFTFVHTSDLQLGMTRHFLDPADAGPRFTQDRIDALVRLGELAAAKDAGCIVVAGDLFESNQLGEQTLVRVIDALSRLPVPIVVLPGNHDPLDAASLYDDDAMRALDGRVVVIREDRPFALPGLPGVEFVGAPWRSKRPSGDLCAAMLAALAPAESVYRIGIAHGQTHDQAPDPDAAGVIDLAAAEQAVRDGRLHYLALGDRHSTTAKGETGAIWYSGAPVATDYDEQMPNHALVVTLTGSGPPVVEPVRVGDWTFDERHFEIDGPDDILQLERWFAGHPSPARTLVYLSLSGTVSLRTQARIDALLDRMTAKYASLRIHRRHHDLVMAPDRFDDETTGLSGYARSAWDRLAAGGCGSGDDARVDRDALALLYRLAGGGR